MAGWNCRFAWLFVLIFKHDRVMPDPSSNMGIVGFRWLQPNLHLSIKPKAHYAPIGIPKCQVVTTNTIAATSVNKPWRIQPMTEPATIPTPALKEIFNRSAIGASRG
jgi:hypothetical protein